MSIQRISNKRPPSKGQKSKLFCCIAHPDRIRPIYEILGGYTYQITCAASVATGAYGINNVGGANVSYTAGASDTAATILRALLNKINDLGSGVTAHSYDVANRTIRISQPTAWSPAPTVTSPTSELTISSAANLAAVTKGATTITLPYGLKSRIEAGERLLFIDSDENYVMIAVTAVAAAGATSLTIAAAPKAIAQGSQCEFPGYFWDLTAAGIGRSYDREQTQTFNTGTDSDGVITGSSKDMAPEVLYTPINGALHSAWYSADNALEVYLERELPPANGFSRGHVTYGFASVTGMGDAAPIGNTTMSPQFTFNGAVTEVLPEAAPA